jgi:uncharacterized protein YkvS
MGEYDDIINLKRPISKRNKMNIIQRANIFNPFAALTGYQESINEAGRIVDKKLELDIDKQNDLDNKINYLLDNLNTNVQVIYFKKDLKKEGGMYLSIEGIVNKINLNDKIIVVDKKKIEFSDLYEIIIV